MTRTTVITWREYPKERPKECRTCEVLVEHSYGTYRTSATYYPKEEKWSRAMVVAFALDSDIKTTETP